MRAAALAAQAMPQHHNYSTTLWCELGFLFHMMRAVESAPVVRSARGTICNHVPSLNMRTHFRARWGSTAAMVRVWGGGKGALEGTVEFGH